MALEEESYQKVMDKVRIDYQQGRDIDRIKLADYPDKATVLEMTGKLQQLLLPGIARGQRENMDRPLQDGYVCLRSLGEVALGDRGKAEALSLAFFTQLPSIRALLQRDLQAAFEGDPAATGKEEVILSYPGFYAVSIYRLAHALHLLGLPMIPRMMTEYAHSVTGIDIHPGAQIGGGFFIDHGTGIVIGETTRIGEDVKIYQGVTLGGLSTRGGQELRGKKRHPTIEDDVTIYANATILGGETVIGRGAVIGAGVFLTGSVSPGTLVTAQSPQLQYSKKKTRV